MNIAIASVIALVLALAPWVAALPDETLSDQTLWSSVLSALVMAAALLGIVQAWKSRHGKEAAAPSESQGEVRGRRRGRREGRQKGGGQGREDLAPTGTSGAFVGARSPRPLSRPFSPVTVAFLTLLALAALSLMGRLVAQHSAAYLSLMLHGWMALATQFALFLLCRRLAQDRRSGLYAVLLAAVAGSAIVSIQGLMEFLMHGFAGDPHDPGRWAWRVFSTSTPDFLAGFLVLLLPVTLALFLAIPLDRRAPLLSFLLTALCGLVFLAQLLTLLTTGSRFALVSLTVSFLVMAAAFLRARASGLILAASSRWRLIGLTLLLLLPSLLFVKPVLRRLQNPEANSAAFRVWTWKGAARMALANPLLGTGVGAWVDLYPPYALTGFTRLAHNSYLQMADECGLPALLALLATLGLAGVAARRGLDAPPDQGAGTAAWQEVFAPADDRLLHCGLLGGLAAGVVQNIIDSDWYVFFLGVTFWSLAGLAVGRGERADAGDSPRPTPRLQLILAGGAAGALLILFGTQGMAAYSHGQAQRETDPVAAQLAYAQAQAWDPLNARYPGDLGYRVYYRAGNLSTAETSLRLAAALEPNGVNFQRLGDVLEAQGRHADALAAYRDGLRVDPNKLDLLLNAARLSPPSEALDFYQKVAALEDSPVGQVRAIGELTEVKFAEGDAALAENAARQGNTEAAARDSRRAARLLEAYADEGGTSSRQRQVLIGFHPRPEQDTHYRDLYARVMAIRAGAASAGEKPAVQSRAQDYDKRFQAILAQDYAQIGDDALAGGAAPEAALSFSRAADFLQTYADGGGAHDAKRDDQMQTLYLHVMDRLLQVSPPEQRAALLERARRYAAKFAALFPPR